MPNKHNAERRHHIPKMKFRVRNWAQYDAGLRRRGSLTLWVTHEVMAGWRAAPRSTRGGQPSYSDLAIETGHCLEPWLCPRLRRKLKDRKHSTLDGDVRSAKSFLSALKSCLVAYFQTTGGYDLDIR
jgi:Transposase DDE domain